MRITVGHSEDPSTPHALEEVLREARAGEAGRPAAAMVFTAMLHDHRAIGPHLLDALGPVPLIGCTTDGELSASMGFLEDSLVLVLFWDVEATAGVGTGVGADPVAAVQAATTAVEGDTGLVIALPAGLDSNGSAVVHALADTLPDGLVAVGATAGDQWCFERSFQLFGGEVHHDAVVLLHLRGAFRVSVGVGWGWTALGSEGAVTASKGNVLEQIDDQPALAFFRRHFGGEHEPIPQFPLTVELPDGGIALRAPMTYDPATGSVVMAGDVPVGARVRLSEATSDEVLHGSRQAIAAALADGDVRALLAFSCAARKHVLGTRTEEEVELLRAVCPGRSLAGFYGYGEFLIHDGRGVFFNETLVAVAIRGDAA